MEKGFDRKLNICLENFQLPKYDSIPDVGLYLEQTVRYVNGFFSAFPYLKLTGSMVSNYVKQGLVENPVKKQYFRDHIALLIFIAVVKNVLSLDNISLLFEIRRETYSIRKAYDYFYLELENVLAYVFGVKDRLDLIGTEATEQKFLLRNAIISVAYKMYLDQYFAARRRQTEA